jgi:hypothetical protein
VVRLAASVAASLAALAGCDQAPLSTAPSATATVTPAEGGSVVLADGRARIDVPPGAVASPVSITIVETARPAPPGFTARSPVFDLAPAGLSFARPARVTFAFAPAVRPGIFWSNAGGGYDPVDGRASGATISGAVTHFSSGFVGELVNDTPPAPGDGGDDGPGTVVSPLADAEAPAADAHGDAAPADAHVDAPPADAPVDAVAADAPADAGPPSTCQAGLSCAAGSGCAETSAAGCQWCACGADGRLACASCDAPWPGSGTPPPTSCGSGPRCAPAPAPSEGCAGGGTDGCISGCTCAPTGYFTCTVKCPTLAVATCSNAGRWVNRASTALAGPSPDTRNNPALAYDVATSRTVMYGGYGGPGASFLQDTWEWNGAAGAWTERNVAAPGAFDGASVTYDSARQRLVLFEALTAELWEWYGLAATWQQRAPVTPTAVWPALSSELAATAAYDPVRKLVVVLVAPYGTAPHTWELDPGPGVWIDRGTSAQPSGLQWLVWDPARQRCVGFGGQATNEMWEWDGQAGVWTMRPVVGMWPGPRSGAAMVLDSGAGRPLLFGGQSPSGPLNPAQGPPQPQYDTQLWEWEGELGQWRVVDDGNAVSAPAGRTGHAMAYDLARSTVVMFGGSGPSMSLASTSAELWEWTRTPPPPDAGCDAGP